MCSGVLIPPGESASTKLQMRLLKEASAFIITHQIPAFVSTPIVCMIYRHIFKHETTHHIPVCILACLQVEHCLQSSEAPMDGASLKQVLKLRGINLRYLGHVIKIINQSENKERLRHIMVCLTDKCVMRLLHF